MLNVVQRREGKRKASTMASMKSERINSFPMIVNFPRHVTCRHSTFPEFEVSHDDHEPPARCRLLLTRFLLKVCRD
jgi:hypothetical protein